MRLPLGLFCLQVWIFLASESYGQLASQESELDKPIIAVTKLTSWLRVFEHGFDLEVTAHSGGETGDEPPSLYETLHMCRLVNEPAQGIVFAPWAQGSIEVRLGKQPYSNDRRDRGVRILKEKIVREDRFGSNTNLPTHKCGNDCLRRVCPFDFEQAVFCPMVVNVNSAAATQEASQMEKFLETLSTLKSAQLNTTKEKINSKEFVVFRIKANTSPKSVAIPVHRIVVSNEGHDVGLVTEIHLGLMKLKDKSKKYQSEDQLDTSLPRHSHIISWELVSLSTAGKDQELVLPVSVSKKRDFGKVPDHKAYCNIEFKWKTFNTDSKEICSIEACQKLTQQYQEKIDSVLAR